MENSADRFRCLERAYRTSLAAHRAMLRARSEAELLTEFCRLAVEVAGYRLAWLGYAESGEAKRVRPVAHAGFDAGYLERLEITWGEGDHGAGPTGAALRSGRTQVAQHIATDPHFAPWREDATRRGYASSAALPLRDGALTFGALNLYAPEPYAFDAEELELLEQVADDLAHGILFARGQLALSAMQQSLEQLNRVGSSERMAAALAHDVNNYLAVVLPALHRLRKSARPDDQPLVGEALEALDRAIALNRDAMRAAAEAPVEPLELELDHALGGLAGALRSAAGSAVQLALALGAPGARVRMDPGALEQVVLNLVVNARDAMPRGGRIELGTRPEAVQSPLPANRLGMRPGDYLALRVADSGQGIPPELLDRVFEPFFTTKGRRGTGLGLATARGLVHQAGGRLTAASAPGQGTTFEVLLPRLA